MTDGLTPHFASADEILRTADERYEDVWVPQWQTMVRLRGLRGDERDKLEGEQTKLDNRGRVKMDLTNFRARMIALSAVDLEGQPLFRPDQVTALGRKSAAALDLLFDTARRLSGMSQSDVDQLTGESPSGQSDDSGTGSPLPSVAAPSPSSSAA